MGLLSVDSLSYKYKDYVLRELSFCVESGVFISLLGVNGAGKSTLIKNINRLLKPYSGSIDLKSVSLSDYSKENLAIEMAYVSQYNNSNSNTVFDTVLVGRYPHKGRRIDSEDYDFVAEILEKMELTDYAMRNTDTLSGGEFQKVVIARALAQSPSLILLDEPTSSLDIKNQVVVLNLLKKYCKDKNISLIVSIHDINLALKFSDRYLLLKDGFIHSFGDSNVINAQSINDVYGIDVDVIEHKGNKIVITC